MISSSVNEKSELTKNNSAKYFIIITSNYHHTCHPHKQMAIVSTSIVGVHCECVCVDDWTAKKVIIARNDDKNRKYDELCNKISDQI